MAVNSTWTNGDGLLVRFGVPEDPNNRPGMFGSETGVVKQLVVDFSFDNLPAPSTSEGGDAFIPAKAYVVASRLLVDSAWVGGTDLAIGTEQQDGTDIDLDGFHTAAQLVTASLTAGAILVGAGADVGTVVDATNNAYIKVTATGTYTAGTARLVIDYIPKHDV